MPNTRKITSCRAIAIRLVFPRLCRKVGQSFVRGMKLQQSTAYGTVPTSDGRVLVNSTPEFHYSAGESIFHRSEARRGEAPMEKGRVQRYAYLYTAANCSKNDKASSQQCIIGTTNQTRKCRSFTPWRSRRSSAKSCVLRFCPHRQS